jgi:hypothetical protein
MENPATWNNCIKILNNNLDYGNGLSLSIDKVLSVLIENDLLIGEGKSNPHNHMIRETIDEALISFKYENDNQCCGNSVGNKIYHALKKFNVVA